MYGTTLKANRRHPDNVTEFAFTTSCCKYSERRNDKLQTILLAVAQPIIHSTGTRRNTGSRNGNLATGERVKRRRQRKIE
jgi:hypothetical protein